MTKNYNSFKEMDEQLKILKLQREIQVEKLKLDLDRAKANLYPSKLLEGFSGTLKQTALTFAIRMLYKLFRKRQHPGL